MRWVPGAYGDCQRLPLDPTEDTAHAGHDARHCAVFLQGCAHWDDTLRPRHPDNETANPCLPEGIIGDHAYPTVAHASHQSPQERLR